MKYNISNLIKTYRKKKGITQSELARGICTQAIISKIENSETTPSMEIFFLLCERLEIPTNEILKVLEFDLATEKKEYFIIEDSKAQSVMCSAVLDVLETDPGLAVRFFKNKIGKQLDTWVQDGVVEAEKLMTKMVSCFKKNKKTSHANTINGQFLDF